MSKIEDLMAMPEGSLEVGILTSSDKEGKEWTNVTVDGTPEGFRALAGMLVKMADSVGSGEAKGKGWGLELHPDEVKGLVVRGMESLSLGCRE